MASFVPTGDSDPRTTKLRIHFRKIVNGEDRIVNNRVGRLFIESICVHPDPVACIETLISSTNGLSAVRLATSVDLSCNYLNDGPTSLLRYLQAPELEIVGGGQFLLKAILSVVEPPAFWNAFLAAQKNGLLIKEATQCFTWLLFQLVSLPLPLEKATSYYDVARDESLQKMLLGAFDSKTRTHAQRIKHIIETVSRPGYMPGDHKPGGRHDNDNEDIMKIAILPTPDEINSDEPPFLRQAADVDEHEGEGRLALHIDNQFRLLREDMLRDLREELPVALGIKKGRRRGLTIPNLRLNGVHCDDRNPWSLRLQCSDDLPRMPKADYDKRKKFLVDNPNLLRNGSLACLVADNQTAALVIIRRNEDMLAENPPNLCVNFSGRGDNTRRALMQLRLAAKIQLVQLNTAVFAYEPILRQLQATKELQLRDEIVHWTSSKSPRLIPPQHLCRYTKLLEALQKDPTADLKSLLALPKSTRLDESQAQCFVAGITQRLSLVQGPPGTGKSVIGALMAKAIYLFSKRKILVVCYTNHALDQFLDDLREVGISDASMVRIGSPAKASPTSQPLLLGAQPKTHRFSKLTFDILNAKKMEARVQGERLQKYVANFQANTASKSDIFEHLEFSLEDSEFRDAFEVPKESSGMMRVGKNGKAIDEFYLLNRWGRGYDAGIFKDAARFRESRVWKMDLVERGKHLEKWKAIILSEHVSNIYRYGKAVNEAVVDINALFTEKDRRILQEKRIIGCTTTGAAKYVQSIQSSSPGVLLVEEAGEILESHVLTALGPQTEQMILIGDHKQLRPKVHYDLSVEKDDGYDLNKSLFERLILKGYPHLTLLEQHRMRPEISSLVRCLTYPGLTDAPSTTVRPALRGFEDHLIFVDHRVAEEEAQDVPDWKDQSSPSSKRNVFEANMTLKCVRYLAQQGYGTEQIVVLTPYVAQLRLLYDVLSEDNDPVLNDLDSYDLVRAGLMPPGTAKQLRRPLKISTVDNYQGEESDIVVVSLTRSNPNGDIGFLSQPERLNVLLSRARNALIMIGNVNTFLKSRRGNTLWQRLFELLRNRSHIYDGFPVHCEQHPDRKAVLCSPEDFDMCPDGGCREPCQTLLSCGTHLCPQRCHQIYDHSKMKCTHILKLKCPVGHLQSRECHASSFINCRAWEKKKLTDERRKREEFERQRQREALEQQHSAQVGELDHQMQLLRDQNQHRQLAEELLQALEQKKRDLESAKRLAKHRTNVTFTSIATTTPEGAAVTTSPPDSKTVRGSTTIISPPNIIDSGLPTYEIQSPSELEWERLKRQENTSSDELDSLMKMTGLEHVKEQFLTVKAKIDTTQRQGIDLKKERFGVVLLGNPGTGKTTVARLYASVLTNMGVLPGGAFVETTGSSLASDGVAAAKKHVETILNAGGGAFFLDEAYQLALGHNYGGKAVLDFLLAEIENQVGKIVFIFAGYSQQMEAFFEHNPGLDSRMPYRLRFDDYNDKELLLMFSRLVSEKYSDRMKIEGGINGLYARILVSRLGRGRGKQGFGNARTLENVLAKISERQADRLRRDRASGMRPDDFLFTKEDLIGPKPIAAVLASSAWKELQGLVGLEAVKGAVRVFLDRINLNYQRELEEKPLVEVSLNRVFVGSPGTGKTTVGKLYGQILADIGVLSSAEVVLKNPADFIGSVLGQSEENTKAILKATEGKVLIIDEAYMLASGGGVSQVADPYKTAIVDTIVAEVQSTPGEDRCVLLLGYEEQMRDMFRNTNPGLSRRFPLSDAFYFEDFDDDQLRQILDSKLRKQGLDATKEAKDVVIKVLAKARRRLHFGNAGEVENMINHAKGSYQLRQSPLPAAERSTDIIFEPQDFDADFNREKGAASNLKELFKDIVGSYEVVKKFEGYMRAVDAMRARGKDPESQIPFNFIFKGPPGTGKTSTARKIGQIYYDMGFLSSTKVHDCSATDLIAGHIGQTGLKTIEVLNEALGAVLFIDEAYRLAEGHFATEAINTLVDSLTKPQYAGKMLVVLAGYEHNMNDLLKVNPGLSSRFPEEIIFKNMLPEDCLKLLQLKLEKDDITLETTDGVDQAVIIEKFMRLSELPSWGNGRDVETFAKFLSRETFQNASEDKDDGLVVPIAKLVDYLESFLQERTSREKSTSLPLRSILMDQPMAHDNFSTKPPNTKSSTKAMAEAAPAVEFPKLPELLQDQPDPNLKPQSRDVGVSDCVWRQLQIDNAEHAVVQKLAEDRLRIAKEEVEAANDQAETLAAELALAAQQAEKNREDDELKRRHEEMRLKHLASLFAKREAEEREKRAREEGEKRRKQEARAQTKLREMGVCSMGYRWIKQSAGYRCAGGSHFVSNSELGSD